MGIFELPAGYSEIKKIDMMKDKKLAIWLNVGALIIAVPLFLLGIAIAPFDLLLVSNNLFLFLLKALGLLVALIGYIILHELIHGMFFKKYSGKKAKYGFNGLFAYASGQGYYHKRQYLIIGLAPVVLLGFLLLLLNIFLPIEWFWFVYFIQITNLSGAVGDFYVTYLLCKAPEDILVHDEGTMMIFCSRLKK